jgi:mono/diheme cytochrome c family protein
MPNYASQVSAPDRWAIIAYLRVLQRSQRATLADVPERARQQLENAGKRE